MAAYHQMGNDTQNLVGENGLEKYKGIVLSPVNRDPISLQGDVAAFRKRGEYDIVLDPQLYFPRSEKLFLLEQPYYPSNFDTADMTSFQWWEDISNKVVSYAQTLQVDAIATPAFLPKTWSDDYFGQFVELSSRTTAMADATDLRVLMTVVLNLSSLGEQGDSFKLASILSEANVDGYYFVVVSDREPRREFNSDKELLEIMKLIQLLESHGRPVIMSHCSSDMILFKAAGASHCASGKFFNLRRFTKSRYEEPSGGGGQLPYWFEESLLSFLREADVLRLRDNGLANLTNSGYSASIWSKQILDQFDSSPTKAWVGLGWRQYLCWFAAMEEQLGQGDGLSIASELLKAAEVNWLTLDDKGILLDEPRNNGEWIRSWRQALVLFQKFVKEQLTGL